MKRVLFGFILTICVLGLAFTPVVQADTDGSATSSVAVTVAPNIAIQPMTPYVDAGSVQTGEFFATLIFRIDANMQYVNMFVEASSLYKGDDPTDPTVAPIDVALAKPVGITIEDGNEVDAGDNKAAWTTAGDPIGDYPTMKTETVTYESSQNGHFSQPATVVITYTQPDPEKPQGQYTGKVRMTVLL